MTTHRTPLFEKQGTFFKVDDELGIAYGWAIVCAENDVPYFDLQGDHIPEAPMVEALLDFSKNSRVGKDQHAGDQTGEHVFMYPVTKATMVGLGISSPKTGAIVAYKPTNPADLDMIKNGTRTGFSIGGVLTAADETEVGKTLAKSYAAGAKKKGRVFRTFKIHEISLVDRPAQQGATVGLVKRAVASVPDFEKMMKLSSIEVRLKDMDRMGIDIQAVSPAPQQTYYWTEPGEGQALARMVNERLARIVAQWPDRFVGLGTIPLQDAGLAVSELTHCVKTLGLRGVEINPSVNGMDLVDPKLNLEKFFAKAQELDIVIFMHPIGFTQGERLMDHYFNNVIGNPLETTYLLSRLIFDGDLT